MRGNGQGYIKGIAREGGHLEHMSLHSLSFHRPGQPSDTLDHLRMEE